MTRGRSWLIAVAGVVAVVLAGPRTCVREPEAVPAAPMLAALPAWLDAREDSAGVRDGAVRKRVRFATPSSPARTRWSVVYLHGFSATRQETAPVSEEVAARLGANLFETRLRGHGLPGDSLGDVSAGDWLADATEALAIGRALGDSVLVIGTSTGGTLAVWLATRAREAQSGLARVVLISPNFGPRDAKARILTWPWASVILPRLSPTRAWTPANDAQARYWTVRYPTRALFPMQALVEHVRAAPLTTYRIPTLVFYSRQDDVVDATRTLRWLDRLERETSVTPVRVEVIPTAGEDDHVLAGRIVSPSQTATFVDRIVRFAQPPLQGLSRRSP